MTPTAQLRRRLTIASLARFIVWRLRGSLGNLELALRTGERIQIRAGSKSDLGIACEIFGSDYYDTCDPRFPRDVSRIVDLGANVGYSVAYWLRRFPRASVIAYEPHPAHIRQIEWHCARNRITERVTLRPVAVSTRAAELHLSDEGAASITSEVAGAGTIVVKAVDWLAEAGGQRIDLLKIDIEGAEMALFEDPRFGKLDVGCVVLEWHKTESHPDAASDCERLLRGFGFDVTRVNLGVDVAGMMWAFRSKT